MQPRRLLKPPLRVSRKLDTLFTTDQFTYTQIRQMFIPLLLDQLFIFAINILSMAMVSSSSEEAISAVSLVGSIGFIVSSVFSAVGTGGTILIAQARGSGDEERVRRTVGQSILLSVGTAVFCTAFFLGFADSLVRLMYPSVSPLLLEYSVEYLRYMSLSYIPFALFNAIFGAFRGLGDSKSGLVLTITINSIHLVASFLLITVMDLGITGSGLSYIIARVIGAVVAMLWMFRIHNTVRVRLGSIFQVSRSIQKAMIKLALPLATEQMLFQVGLLITQTFIAKLPTASIAAHGIANSAFGLYNAVAFTLTTMVTIVCGQCIGAKRLDLAGLYTRHFVLAGRGVLLAAVVCITPLLPPVLSLYSPSAEAWPQIYVALLIVVAPLPLLWCNANLPGAAMRAAGDAAYVTVVSMIAMWTGRVMIGYLLTIPLGLGISGVWIGLVLEWALRAVLLRSRMRNGKWLAKAKAAA